jgi:hypothetical protein
MAIVRLEGGGMIQKLRLPLLFAILASMIGAGFLFVVLTSRDAPASSAAFNDDQAKTAAKADRLVAELLKRPLFTPGREPPRPKVVVAQPPVLQGRLAGVMLRPDARIASFTRPGGRPVSIREGQVIDGWTASKIEEGRVVLTSSFGQQIVKPTNASAEEVTPGKRPVKKPAPNKNQPAKPGAPKQAPQQMAKGAAPAGAR